MPTDPFISACKDILRDAERIAKAVAGVKSRVIVSGPNAAEEEFGREGKAPRPFARVAMSRHGAEWDAMAQEARYVAAQNGTKPDYAEVNDAVRADIAAAAEDMGMPNLAALIGANVESDLPPVIPPRP